jgi:hypothetical protein
MDVRWPRHYWVRAALGVLVVVLVSSWAWLVINAFANASLSRQVKALQKAVDTFNVNSDTQAKQFTFCQQHPDDAICEKPLVVSVPPDVVKENPSAITVVPVLRAKLGRRVRRVYRG